MKLLFVHSTKMKMDTEGQYYTGGSYNNDIFNRYLSLSENLSVIARKESKIYETEYAKKNFNYFAKDKIKFIEIPDLTSSYKSFTNLKSRDNYKKIIKNAILEHDYIIARLPSNSGNIAIKYAKKHNKPYLVEVVGCPWDSLWNHSLKGKLLAIPSYLSMKNSVINASHVVYVTNEFLQSRYPTKGENIGCSDVSLPSIDEDVLEQRLNKINQMSEDKPVILGTTAAVNIRYKGQEFVIKAISKLNREGYNFEYHLAGGGDNSYLKSIAEKYNVVDKVKFLGSIPHEKVFKYLDNIDIYIQPSMTEGLPRALIEAMSRGCPSIGSNVGGIPELISSEFIFKAKDVNDLTEKLIKMNKENMVKEAERNFNKAKEFDKDLLNKKRIEFYRSFKEGIDNHD